MSTIAQLKAQAKALRAQLRLERRAAYGAAFKGGARKAGSWIGRHWKGTAAVVIISCLVFFLWIGPTYVYPGATSRTSSTGTTTAVFGIVAKDSERKTTLLNDELDATFWGLLPGGHFDDFGDWEEPDTSITHLDDIRASDFTADYIKYYANVSGTTDDGVTYTEMWFELVANITQTIYLTEDPSDEAITAVNAETGIYINMATGITAPTNFTIFGITNTSQPFAAYVSYYDLELATMVQPNLYFTFNTTVTSADVPRIAGTVAERISTTVWKYTFSRLDSHGVVFTGHWDAANTILADSIALMIGDTTLYTLT
jgi:hypothetical protein